MIRRSLYYSHNYVILLILVPELKGVATASKLLYALLRPAAYMYLLLASMKNAYSVSQLGNLHETPAQSFSELTYSSSPLPQCHDPLALDEARAMIFHRLDARIGIACIDYYKP